MCEEYGYIMWPVCVCVWYIRLVFIHRGLGVIDSGFCLKGPPTWRACVGHLNLDL